MLTNVQTYLANISFLLLLGAMILYWVGPLSRDLFVPKIVGQTSSNPPQLRSMGLTTDGKNSIGTREFDVFKDFGRYCIIITNICLVLLLSIRWKESGHFPLSNLYESLMFLSWSFTVIHLLIENEPTREGNRQVSPTSNVLQAGKFIGAITTPSALFTNAFATFTLPKEMQEASPLVPALQSNWLMMHVTVMILSYAALIIGSLLSIAFLILTIDFAKRNPTDTQNPTQVLRYPVGMSKTPSNGLSNSIALTLDNLSYRIIGIGFPFLTIGILSGAVWANEAWGSYWSWDPKETWALLTWLIFAIYLHTRLNKGWEGKKPAIIASFGFIIVWICYLGVNLIGEGLHSYGWMANS